MHFVILKHQICQACIFNVEELLMCELIQHELRMSFWRTLPPWRRWDTILGQFDPRVNVILLKIVINEKSSWLHQARAAGIRIFLRFCHGLLIFIHDILFFSVLVFRRHINYKIAQNWYHSVFPFSNYYYYQGQHLELWFSVGFAVGLQMSIELKDQVPVHSAYMAVPKPLLQEV
jgi:hypothetical protein